MAKARKILRHVKAIRNIGTVTKTMGMVATARFKKTFGAAVAARPYTSALTQVLSDVVAAGGGDEPDHPLMRASAATTDVLLVLTSHRGLCGGYNSAIVRLAMERVRQLQEGGRSVLVRCSGRRGGQILRARGVKLDKEYLQFDYLPDVEKVTKLARGLMDEFCAGAIGGVEAAYMQFVSAGQQKPAIAPILPLTELSVPGAGGGDKGAVRVPYEMLPSVGDLLAELLPAGVRMKLYQCFLDAAVSEQIARRTAMQAASDNAREMIHHLTIQYNRARQSQITTELAEIMGGAEGLK